MATATATAKTKTENATAFKRIPLAKIKGNTAQSRGMGVLSNLRAQGYGVFGKVDGHDDKDPIWEMLLAEKPEDRKKAMILIQENEPSIVELAEGMENISQLEPIGVVEDDDGDADVVFGMRRCLAVAYNYASSEKNPDWVEAKVFGGKFTPFDLKMMALEENADREDESPIDKAITYQWLCKEGKMKPKEVGLKIGQSDQSIRNYILLLDEKLEDKRMDIHTGKMSVDRALKLLRKRKAAGKDAEEEKTETTKDKRFRLPGSKGIQAIYEARVKPKKMDDKEWMLWTLPDVRKFIAHMLGFRFKEYVPPTEKELEAIKKAKKKGRPAKAEKGEASADGKPKKILKVKKKRAQDLLVSLGKTQARTWDDKTLAEKLENIVNIVEEGQKAENESLQGLLDKLVAGYKEGIKVKLVDE